MWKRSWWPRQKYEMGLQDWPEEQQALTVPEARQTPDRWVLVAETRDQKIELENGEVKLTVDCAAEVHVCPLCFGER